LNTAVGKLVAEKAGIDVVTFDRGGYLYHGRIKSLAGARAAGLKFLIVCLIVNHKNELVNQVVLN
jgi:hypothetical protein